LSPPYPTTFSSPSRNEINNWVSANGFCLSQESAQPTPTPTPTATPGGGGGGGGGGGNGSIGPTPTPLPLPTIAYSNTLKRDGSFAATIDLSGEHIDASCTTALQ